VRECVGGFQGKRRKVGEERADRWALSVREIKRKGATGLGWFGWWADSVPGRPRLPFLYFFSSSFFFYFSDFCFVCLTCLKTNLFGFG
jgi:hypothetical protein